MRRSDVYRRFLIWRLKSIGQRQFILLLSIVIGLGVGLSAVVVKNLVHYLQLLLTEKLAQPYNYLYFAFPVVGILLTVIFIKYINRQPVRDGVPNVLHSISKKNGIISRHNIYSSIITSSLTVGFGGSVGLEGPTVLTGAAIGANLGRYFRMEYTQIILLIGCACSGAMAAIFKAPIAAIVFSLEVIMLDLTLASLIPLLISSLTAAVTSYLLLGQNVLYPVTVHDPFNMAEIPYFILLGILAGLVSVYFTRMYAFITSTFEKIGNIYKKLAIGAIILGLIIFLVPSLYGEGYQSINSCLNGDYSYLFDGTLYEKFKGSAVAVLIVLFFVTALKAFATSVTIASGGIGGIFAPSLFIGSNLGLIFAKLLSLLNVNISESNYALVGMAGLIAGVIHAPLTAIFLIAEITGGYELFFPLMIVSTISFITVRYITPNSIYTIQLAKRGELLTHDKDHNVLLLMQIDNLIETDFKTIHPDASLGDLVEIVKKSHRNIFPVVDEHRNFHGIVKMDHIRQIMFESDKYDTTPVRDLMFIPEYTISLQESMEEVVRKFQISKRYNIAVLDHDKYIGFLSRARVFSSYRETLKKISRE
jgi:CIC family chloride channel protein